MPEPVQCLPAVLPAAVCLAWLQAIDAQLCGVRPDSLHESASRQIARPPSALRLFDVAGVDGAALRALLRRSALGEDVTRRLGGAVWCNLDQCWVRRQHPAQLRPNGQHPHSWHQDGALGHDFLHADAGKAGLLQMLTAWIALTPCGSDAPALEWAAWPTPTLLPLHELTPQAVCRALAAHGEHRIVSRTLAAGDALLFDGSLLHRTQCTQAHPAMSRTRTSIELRFFSEVPARLRLERFLPF